MGSNLSAAQLQYLQTADDSRCRHQSDKGRIGRTWVGVCGILYEVSCELRSFLCQDRRACGEMLRTARLAGLYRNGYRGLRAGLALSGLSAIDVQAAEDRLPVGGLAAGGPFGAGFPVVITAEVCFVFEHPAGMF